MTDGDVQMARQEVYGSKKTIRIELDSQVGTSEPALGSGEMSPAYRNNGGFKKAAAKMSPVGNETKWPRKDNAFMAKNALSYQEYESKIWMERPRDQYETQLEWLAYAIMGILISLTAFVMDLIEESLVHFKDHYT